MRQAALKILPSNAFVLLKQDVVIKRLGGAESYIKECTESSCIVNLGKKAQVDYVSQASVSKLGNKIRLKIELYNVYTEGLVSLLSDEKSENLEDLLAIVESRVPDEVFGKIMLNMETEHQAKAALEKDKAEPVEIPPKIETGIPPKQEPSRITFWAGIGLEVLGVALAGVGYMQHEKMWDAYDKYYNIGDDASWKEVESSRTSRNVLYVVGGLLLASGIGVHIWF